ncbi:acetolactate synthase 2 catalytic subunit [Brevundimonas sp.]|uniref:acetolactate synthase 2 catalytic subunit n=1 Tax=Brevundimonas sp. TaxID=1871086 RepID=UPI0028A0DF9D|nr:acetolactate synthase 2 catalytic subunit [Brevundimonas sp.]
MTVATIQMPANETTATGASLVVSTLERMGVDVVFGYPGGAIMPIYDAIAGSGVRHYLCRHEQGAAFAADAYARTSGKVGVCMATSGPGATNLVTGIANAMLDSVPMVCITGNVAQGVMGTDAFQEVDIMGVTMPLVKHSYLVRDAADVPAIIEEAFHIARTGRPGPVLIDLPKDIQFQATTETRAFHLPNDNGIAASTAIKAAADAIRSAKRPIIYIGGGAKISGAVETVREFAAMTGIPQVSTLNALGTIPTGQDNYLGMLGMHGTRAANDAVQGSDLLIVVGARFDDRATGKLSEFAPNAGVIHFDVDASEIGKLRAVAVPVVGDLKPNLEALNRELASGDTINVRDWSDQCRAQMAECAVNYNAPGDGVFAPALLNQLSQMAGPSFIAACDVGQHQMWVAQHCTFSRPQAHITSGGLGAMGFGLPAGIGAKLADPDACVVTITGDGGVMMNIQELATVNRFKIPLKIVLLDNSRLGMVRQWQELFFERNFSEIDLSDNPDFVKVAEAFGIEAFRIDHKDQVTDGLKRLLETDGPILAHVIINPEDNVWPLVPPGKNNSEMMEGSR